MEHNFNFESKDEATEIAKSLKDSKLGVLFDFSYLEGSGNKHNIEIKRVDGNKVNNQAVEVISGGNASTKLLKNIDNTYIIGGEPDFIKAIEAGAQTTSTKIHGISSKELDKVKNGRTPGG